MSELPADFRTPLGMFYHWESSTPDSVWLRQCLRDGDTVYTWAQAGSLARRLAAGILSLGLEPGDRVGIYSQNTARWFITDLAIMMAGLVSVPIYASMPRDKLRYIVEHSEMSALFVGDRCAGSAAQMAGLFHGSPSVIGIGLDGAGAGGDASWEGLLGAAEALRGNPDWPRDRLWTLSYTSGTTGNAKAVMHSFSSSAFSAWSFNQVAGLGGETRFFSYLPLAHISERVVVELHSLYCGGSVGFNEGLETFRSDLLRVRPTFFNAVPRIWTRLKAEVIEEVGEREWQRILDDPAYALQAGRHILASRGLDAVVWGQTGAAPMAPDDIRAWRSLGMPLVEGYGQTEIIGLFNTPRDFRIGTVGKAYPPTKMQLSAEGEVLLRSPGNMLGYYKDAEQTAQTLVDGWIRTGDKGAVDDEGFLTLTGRLKDIFKTSKGKYVAPAPIENAFACLPGIAQCCLVGNGLAQPVMLVVAQRPGVLSPEQLAVYLDQVNAGLESHERIGHVIVCAEAWTPDNGLLTLTLKMLRPGIEERYGQLVATAAARREPRVLVEGSNPAGPHLSLGSR